MKILCVSFTLFAALLSASFSAPVVAKTTSSQAVHDARPLQVWSRKDQHIIDETSFINRIARQPFVLLGEVHDNPLHHRLRGRIVSKIAAHRQNVAPSMASPAAVFEHASTDRQSRFDALFKRLHGTQSASGSVTGADIAEFFKAADWTSRGWPKSELFAPLVRAVLSAGMPLYAGDVPRQRIMSVARGSSTPQSQALAETEIARLALDQDLGPANAKASLREIAEAHCGVLPESMLGPMAFAQRLRDATLADTVLKAAEAHGSAILFAGNGHVRDDRGVPWYIRTRTKQPVVSVLFKERPTLKPDTPGAQPDSKVVGSGSAAPDESPTGEHQADYVIWTAPRARPDPCQKLLEKYGKTKR